MTAAPAKAAQTAPRPKPIWRPPTAAPIRDSERRGAAAAMPALGNAAATALARSQPPAAMPRPAPAGAGNAAIAAAAQQTPMATAQAGRSAMAPIGELHRSARDQAAAAPAVGHNGSSHGHEAATTASKDAHAAKAGQRAVSPAAPRGGGRLGAAHPAALQKTAAVRKELGRQAPAALAGGDHEAAQAGPAHDPAFHAVVAKVHGAAAAQRKHGHSAAKAAQAQAAAVSPPAETQGLAADKHVQELDAQKPRPFGRAAFKAALLAKIAASAPKTLGEAAKFKEEGKLGGAKSELHGTVQDGKKEAAGPIADTAAKAPDPSGVPPKPVIPLAGPEPSPPPPDVAAGQAVPKPRPESEVSLKAGPAALDQQMSSAGVSDEQLKKSNEPAFQSALGAKQQAAAQSAAEPAKLRAEEKTTLAAARSGNTAAAHANLGAMHGARGKGLSASQALQAATKAADEAKRAEVSTHILGIYNSAKGAVEARLEQLDKDVDKTFDAGATASQKAFEDYVDKRMTDYKINRYLATPGGSLLWIKDQILNLPDEVNRFYEEGRALYISQMDHVLDSVAATVEIGLAEAKAVVTRARTEIATYVAGLDPALQEVGHKAAADIGKKLDELDQSVADKQNDLIESLTRKYNEALQKVDDRIGEMKAANKGLVDQAKEAVAGVIQTIVNLKNMLLGVLARAANAIDLVIKDPIKFLGNLVSAVGLGVKNFASRIGEHLKQGFMEWLFGAVAAAGIQLPKTFDLKGIASLVLQVLGLTYASFRARAVELLGEKVVVALETAAEIFKKLIAEGPIGVWEWIKEKLGDLKAMVVDKIKEFIVERVIVAGVTWLIGLLNPASAFVKACKAIYDIIMFFVERGSQILALVNAVIDSVTAIAMGQLGGAASMVENALARAIPVVIGFLASLLGVGGISEKIKSTIDTIRKPFAAARDWAILKAMSLVKAAGSFVKGLFGGKKKEDGEQSKDKDLGAAKNAARDAMRSRLGAETTIGEARHAAIDVQRQLQPLGLKSIAIGPEDKDGNYEIFAEASLRERLSILAQKKVIVAVSAKIQVQDKPVQEGQAHPQRPLLSGKDILIGIENRPLNPTQAAPLHVAEQKKSAAFREALGGSGKAALLPEVSQGADTRAKVGYTQRSSGFIIEPEKTSSELEVVSWNTSEPKKSANISHAERQIFEWFNGRQFSWKQRVLSINIRVEGRPICPKCEDNFNFLKKNYPWIQVDWSGEDKNKATNPAEKVEVESA